MQTLNRSRPRRNPRSPHGRRRHRHELDVVVDVRRPVVVGRGPSERAAPRTPAQGKGDPGGEPVVETPPVRAERRGVLTGRGEGVPIQGRDGLRRPMGQDEQEDDSVSPLRPKRKIVVAKIVCPY